MILVCKISEHAAYALFLGNLLTDAYTSFISIIGRSLALMSAWNSCIVVVAHQKTSSAPRRNAARCAVTGRETNQTTITPWVIKMSISFEQSYHTYELL